MSDVHEAGFTAWREKALSNLASTPDGADALQRALAKNATALAENADERARLAKRGRALLAVAKTRERAHFEEQVGMLTALETFKTIMNQRRALVRRLHKAVIGDKRIHLDGNGMWAVLDKSGNPVEISRTRTAAVKALAQRVAQEEDEEPLEDRHEDHGVANPRKPRRAKEDQQYRSHKSGGRLDGKRLTPREDDSGPLIDGARTPRVKKRPRLL